MARRPEQPAGRTVTGEDRDTPPDPTTGAEPFPRSCQPASHGQVPSAFVSRVRTSNEFFGFTFLPDGTIETDGEIIIPVNKKFKTNKLAALSVVGRKVTVQDLRTPQKLTAEYDGKAWRFEKPSAPAVEKDTPPPLAPGYNKKVFRTIGQTSQYVGMGQLLPDAEFQLAGVCYLPHEHFRVVTEDATYRRDGEYALAWEPKEGTPRYFVFGEWGEIFEVFLTPGTPEPKLSGFNLAMHLISIAAFVGFAALIALMCWPLLPVGAVLGLYWAGKTYAPKLKEHPDAAKWLVFAVMWVLFIVALVLVTVYVEPNVKR